MKTKPQLIEKIYHRFKDKDDMSITCILEEELPDFNPYKIDWERLRDCFLSASNGYISSHLHVAVKMYNSTLPEGLKPLPKEKELSDILWQEMNKNHKPSDIVYEKLAKFLVKTYGTPASNLQPLPSVDELANELQDLWLKYTSTWVSIAKELHSKYGTQPREWWHGDIKGMKVKDKCGNINVLDGRKMLGIGVCVEIEIQDCTPYTAPTAEEAFMDSLSDEQKVLFEKYKSESK